MQLRITPAIQPGKRILVTGANGYIGSHVVDLLLYLGYLVRGTIRAERPWLNDFFDSRHGAGKFESMVVENLNDEEALRKAFNGVSGIIHVATDVSFDADPYKVIPYTVSAVELVLKLAAEASIERVVFTSSSASAVLPNPGVSGIVVNEKSWNDVSIKAAHDTNTPEAAKGFAVYVASKIEAERAAWRWVEENKPKFAFNTVLPNFTIGEVLHPKLHASTMQYTGDVLSGNDMIMKIAPSQHYVNVKDAAKTHIIGLLDPDVNSERLFAVAYGYTWTTVLEILKKLRPSNEKLQQMQAPPDELEDLSEFKPSADMKMLLKRVFNQPDWMTLEESLEEGITSMGL